MNKTIYYQPNIKTISIGELPMRLDVGIDTLGDKVMLRHTLTENPQERVGMVTAILSPEDVLILVRALLGTRETIVNQQD